MLTAVDDPAQTLSDFRQSRATGTCRCWSWRNQLTWKIFGRCSDLSANDKPVAPVIREVVAAERLHGHRVAPHHANLPDVRRGGFGGDAGADQHAVAPVLGFVNQVAQVLCADRRRRSPRLARPQVRRRARVVGVACGRNSESGNLDVPPVPASGS